MRWRSVKMLARRAFRRLLVTAMLRERFGTALAALARLYEASEKCGDMARAAQYSAAVALLLDAWPPDSDPAPSPSSESVGRSSTWPVREQTHAKDLGRQTRNDGPKSGTQRTEGRIGDVTPEATLGSRRSRNG